MRTLAELLIIAILVVLGLSVVTTLLIRRALRRLRRHLVARIGMATSHHFRSYLSHPKGGNAAMWSSPLLEPAAQRVAEYAAGSVLSIRSRLPGPSAAAARVRLALHADITATSRALRTARKTRRPLDELHSSFAMLEAHAHALQVDLQIIAAEPDPVTRARLLAELTARADLIRRSCTQIRAAVLAGGYGSHEPALHRVVDEINDAVAAIRLRASAYQHLSRL